ncbi:MAG: hypothetical protein ACR2PQ_02910, partial [Myxococcota bacterium]
MDIDEARAHHAALRIDDALRRSRYPAERDDFSSRDPHVGAPSRPPRAIDDGSPSNEHVQH